MVITDSRGNILAHSERVKPGNYRFYCSNGGHAAAGMTGALTVT